MDNEMINRVSEAILNTPNASDYKRLVAINAIKAMRELTAELIAAGDIQVEFDSSFELAWIKTIDAIIKS
jgi:hypothetical protein